MCPGAPVSVWKYPQLLEPGQIGLAFLFGQRGIRKEDVRRRDGLGQLPAPELDVAANAPEGALLLVQLELQPQEGALAFLAPVVVPEVDAQMPGQPGQIAVILKTLNVRYNYLAKGSRQIPAADLREPHKDNPEGLIAVQ